MLTKIEVFCNRLRVQARATATVVNQRRKLRQHRAWLLERRVLRAEQVRLSHLENYQRWMQKQYVANSVRDRTQLLRRFYGFLVRRGELAKNPAQGLYVPKASFPLPPAPPDAQTVYGLGAKLDQGNPIGQRNRAIIEVFFSTGLRLSEFLNLQMGDVRPRDRTILVRQGKGRKDRVVLLSKRAHAELSRYIARTRLALAPGLRGHLGWREHRLRTGRDADAALWLASHGGALAQVTLTQLFQRWSRLAGRRITPHLLRHAFAVHLLRRGVDIRHVQALLGHESIDTTRIYLRLVKEDYKKAYDRAFPHIALRPR